MAARRTLKKATAPPSKRRAMLRPTADDDEVFVYLSSGCAVMDAALGGGYVMGRVANIVGDKSAGKTLCAMEICANFDMQFPGCRSRYAESEAAFNKGQARNLGIPLDSIDFNRDDRRIGTVEQLYDDLVSYLDRYKDQRAGLYIIDSLDAISDEAEEKRDFDDPSYGGAKPKAISKLFRMLIDRLKQQNVLFIVISQIRDKLNVTFGETKTRSGGRALDFYCTHIVWVVEIEKIVRQIDEIKRVVGVQVLARVKKNKAGLPFRQAEYPILFGYGIDDLTADVEWLLEVKREKLLAEVGISKSGYKVRIAAIRNRGGEEVTELRNWLNNTVREEWDKIETTFLPQARKYGS